MHRIDTDGHVLNAFNEGDPGVPRQPTQVDKHWLNAVQEEIANTIENVLGGSSLVKGTNTQLFEALRAYNNVRAFGIVQTNATPGGAVSVLTGYLNLGTPTLVAGTPNLIRVPFGTALANANYTPILTDCLTGGGNPASNLCYTVYARNAAYFDVKIFDMTGAEVDPASLALRAFSVQILSPYAFNIGL
jgi:hypothetical protein